MNDQLNFEKYINTIAEILFKIEEFLYDVGLEEISTAARWLNAGMISVYYQGLDILGAIIFNDKCKTDDEKSNSLFC